MAAQEGASMNSLRGMTVKEFKDILGEMKTIYKYKDEETLFGETYDPREGPGTRHVEIYTKDELTGIYITMRKAPERSDDGDWRT